MGNNAHGAKMSDQRMLQIARELSQTGVVKTLLLFFVRPVFWLDRWAADKIFLASMKNPALGTSHVGAGFRMIRAAYRLLRAVWHEAYVGFGLSIYESENRKHYAPGGRGYSNVVSLDDAEALREFEHLHSRLQTFQASYPSMLAFENGDSFLDAGCGKGQNLQFILREFPDSPYTGFDIDERALRVVRIGAERHGSAEISISAGSLSDLGFLSSIPSCSCDHVFACHVISTVFGSGLDATRALRQAIIEHLIRISKKSVLVIDGFDTGTEFDLTIEQRSRAMFSENLQRYFVAPEKCGEAFVLVSEFSTAVYFRKHPETGLGCSN